MKNLMTTSALITAVVAILLLWGCSDEDPIFTPNPNCIGPEGGAIVNENPGGSFDGVRIAVAPGAWEECWNVHFSWETTFTTPNFPDGLEGYESFLTGSVDLRINRQVDFDRWVEAPDSLEISITFPRADGFAPEVGEMVVGFRWDEVAELWRIALPDTLDDDRLVINTHDWRTLWTWGVIDIAEADYDIYVAPAMEELHGSETWTALQGELQELHDSIIGGGMPASCANLITVRDLFAAVRDASAGRLQAFQNGLGGACGVCDVTSSAFYASVVDLAKLHVQAWIYEFMFIENSPHWLLTIYGHIMLGYTHGAIANLPCDFGCFFGEGTTEFYYDLAFYYVATVAVEVINFGMSSGWIDCS